MMTPDERNALCASVDLVELIESHNFVVADKGNGHFITNLRGERTASCHIYPSSSRPQQTWHDFGTEKGGDALTFMLEVVGMRYTDAVAKLQAWTGASSILANQQPQPQPRAKYIPPLGNATRVDWEAIAELRQLPLEAVAWADAVGCLKVGKLFGERHWFLVGNGYVQARRFDGGYFRHGLDKHTLSCGTHGGITIAAGRPWHVIAEGLSGVLDILGLVALTRPALGTGLFSITGSYNARCRWADTMLEAVRGSRVIILPDADDTGRAAEADWIERLAGHAADINVIRPPSPHKDWGDAVKDSHAFAAAEFVHHFLKISNH
jgi:hypothetical protein